MKLMVKKNENEINALKTLIVPGATLSTNNVRFGLLSLNTSHSPQADVFCIVVRAGPTPVRSHMARRRQVPEKSNNVWNSLVRYA